MLEKKTKKQQTKTTTKCSFTCYERYFYDIDNHKTIHRQDSAGSSSSNSSSTI